jgi:hypothetical protein
VSGRMNWDRVNRENRAWREARRAPSGSWEPDNSRELVTRNLAPRGRREVPYPPSALGKVRCRKRGRPSRWRSMDNPSLAPNTQPLISPPDQLRASNPARSTIWLW